MMKRVDVAVYDLIRGAAAGLPLAGVRKFDLLRGGVGYSSSNPAIAAYRAAPEGAAAGIRSGEIKVIGETR